MATTRMAVRLGGSEDDPAPYMRIKADSLNEKEYKKVMAWIEENRNSYDSYQHVSPQRLHPGKVVTGFIEVDFYDLTRARIFIDFLAAEIGAPSNIDSRFTDKVMKIARWEARR